MTVTDVDGQMEPAEFDALSPEMKEEFLMSFLERRSAELDWFGDLTEHLRRRSHRSAFDENLYRLALSAKSIDDLTHLDLVKISRTYGLPIDHADSFFRSIVERRRKRQLGPIPEKYIGIAKDKDQHLADAIGLRTPQVLYSGSFNEIPTGLRTNVMLKPENSSGAKGAYYLFDRANIYSLQHKKTLASWSDLEQAIVEQFGAGSVDDRVWLVQELILEAGGRPARDMKFYAFYGEIGLIQEVDRLGCMQYEFFDADFTVAACGRDHEPRFRNDADTVTDKGGLPVERLETVKWASLQIPAPFMRIDFLNGEHELVFTECSGAPGMSHTLSPEYDTKLGRMYNEAEVRLANDLLGGRPFEGYHSFMKKIGYPLTDDDPTPRLPDQPKLWRRAARRAERELRRVTSIR